MLSGQAMLFSGFRAASRGKSEIERCAAGGRGPERRRLALAPSAGLWCLACLACFDSKRFIFIDPPDAAAAPMTGAAGAPAPGGMASAVDPAAPGSNEGSSGAAVPLAPGAGAPELGAAGAPGSLPGVALDAGSGLGASDLGGAGGNGAVANAAECPAPAPVLLPGAALFSGTLGGGACPVLLDAPYQTAWFTYQDSADLLSVTSVAPGCTADSCALHVQGPAAAGTGYGNYGAGVALPLSTTNAPLDVSAFTGIELFARGTINGTRGPGAQSAPQTFFLKLVTSTDRQGDDFGIFCQIDPSAWTPCRVSFDALTREGFATSVDPATDTFDRTNVLRVELEFRLFRDAVGVVPVPVSVGMDVARVVFF